MTKKLISNEKIITANDTSYTVKFYEHDNGFREFEITASENMSEEMSEIYMSPYYRNVVLKWVSYDIVDLRGNNIIDFNSKKLKTLV